MTPDRRRSRLGQARLYLCTPLRDDLDAFLDAVLAGGVDLVQLRDKDADRDAQLAAAPAFRAACDRHDALFVVNDDPELAVAAGADGVHVGQDDADPATARAIVGPDLLIGRSTHSIAEVDRAQREDCDYFAVGPVSATPTKEGRPGVGLEPVRHAAAVATTPWYVTGGMAPDTAAPVLAARAHGLVVVRALTEAPDPRAVAEAMTALLVTHPSPWSPRG
ncbi:thiamine phosphate synthase [Euzebya sp.]|uniref:thiamine phosphate synthase n=1 Tax=Euzebya sp. TaxID=1971409 RepID=UPI003511C58E